MQKKLYDFLYREEGNHWYHCARQDLLRVYFRQIAVEYGRKLRILDVGSGTGGMFNLLEEFGEVTGFEFSEYAAKLCRKKHPNTALRLGSANNLSELFPAQSFDIVTFFNVLYHQWIEDDAKVVKQAASLIRPGGYLILNEPAFKYLYRDNDKFCYGIRRYTEKEIRGILSTAGLSLDKSTYFNSLCFLPVLALSYLQRYGLMKKNTISNELNLLSGINTLLKYLMVLERIWIRVFGKMPLGVSILSIGKKPE